MNPYAQSNVVELFPQPQPLDPRIEGEDRVRAAQRPQVLLLQNHLYRLDDQVQEQAHLVDTPAYFALQRQAGAARRLYIEWLRASKVKHPSEYVRAEEVDAFIRERLALARATGATCRILTFGANLRVNFSRRDGSGKCWFFEPLPGGYRHCGVPSEPRDPQAWEDALLFRFTARLPNPS